MRGGQSPGSSRSRARERRVYVLRRVLVILAVLLLLVLLVPRACQAIIGSEEDSGSGGDRGAKAPEKAAGAGVTDGDEDATAEKSGAKDGDETDKKSGAGGDKARGDEGTGGRDDEKDLGKVLTETVADRVAEPEETGDEQDVAARDEASADQPAPIAQQAPADQPAPMAQQAPADQPAPMAQQAPADQGTGSSGTAAPLKKPPLEPTPEPRARSKTGPAASGPGRITMPKRAPGPAEQPVVKSASIAKPVLDPVQVSAPEPVDVVPVRVAPVAPAPVQPAPAVDDTAFVGGGSMAPNAGGVVATNFGGGAPVNNAAAFSSAGAVGGVSGGAPIRAFP
jgi:hypothetical protein